jgi:hypothetical protein
MRWGMLLRRTRAGPTCMAALRPFYGGSNEVQKNIIAKYVLGLE